MQQNLEQIRAANALKTAGLEPTTKASVSKLPAMILTNGLLAAIAFAIEPKKDRTPKRPGMQAAMEGVAKHLADPHIQMPLFKDCANPNTLLTKLSSAPATSADLQRASSEALAFLGYVKRFAKPAKPGEGEES
jgi:CRISPR/Cas system CMR-associated protein Cmr5 small subunit